MNNQTSSLEFSHFPVMLNEVLKISLPSSKKKIIIAGEVGFLSKLYWLSIITYIGGGFSSGIHNIMEPAVASNPVVFGPRHQKFSEAEVILKSGGGFCVYNSKTVESTFKKLLSISSTYYPM